MIIIDHRDMVKNIGLIQIRFLLRVIMKRVKENQGHILIEMEQKHIRIVIPHEAMNDACCKKTKKNISQSCVLLDII